MSTATQSAAAVPLLGAKPGVFVEVTPGRKIEVRDPDPVPTYVVAEVINTGAGTFRLGARLLTEWVDMGRATRARLGIGVSENTLRRLGRGGFIRVRQISPGRYEFHLQSWFDHCRAVEADEEFWTAPDTRGRTHRDRFRETV